MKDVFPTCNRKQELGKTALSTWEGTSTNFRHIKQNNANIHANFSDMGDKSTVLHKSTSEYIASERRIPRTWIRSVS